MSVSLCLYYQFIWGKCKDLQRRGRIHQLLCLGGTVSVKLSESRNPVKNCHVTHVPTFNDEDEQTVDIFYIMMIKNMFPYCLQSSLNFCAVKLLFLDNGLLITILDFPRRETYLFDEHAS